MSITEFSQETYAKVVNLKEAVRTMYVSEPVTASKTFQFVQKYGMLCLDLSIENEGASSLTYQINGGSSRTLNAGVIREYASILIHKLEITTTVNCHVEAAGVHAALLGL